MIASDPGRVDRRRENEDTASEAVDVRLPNTDAELDVTVTRTESYVSVIRVEGVMTDAGASTLVDTLTAQFLLVPPLVVLDVSAMARLDEPASAVLQRIAELTERAGITLHLVVAPSQIVDLSTSRLLDVAEPHPSLECALSGWE